MVCLIDEHSAHMRTKVIAVKKGIRVLLQAQRLMSKAVSVKLTVVAAEVSLRLLR